jgi:hypothetical protein
MTGDLVFRIVVGLSIWTAGSIVLGLLLSAVMPRDSRTPRPKDW